MKVRRRAGLFSKFFNAVASASCVVAVGEETGGGQGFSRGLLVRDVSSGEFLPTEHKRDLTSMVKK